MWLVFAVIAAACSAASTIFEKIGVAGADPATASAVRATAVCAVSSLVMLGTRAHHALGEVSARSLVFLALSGLATSGAWLSVSRALQLGDASKVGPFDKVSVIFTAIFAFVFLHEPFTAKTVIGCLLITAGALVIAL